MRLSPPDPPRGPAQKYSASQMQSWLRPWYWYLFLYEVTPPLPNSNTAPFLVSYENPCVWNFELYKALMENVQNERILSNFHSTLEQLCFKTFFFLLKCWKIDSTMNHVLFNSKNHSILKSWLYMSWAINKYTSKKFWFFYSSFTSARGLQSADNMDKIDTVVAELVVAQLLKNIICLKVHMRMFTSNARHELVSATKFSFENLVPVRTPVASERTFLDAGANQSVPVTDIDRARLRAFGIDSCHEKVPKPSRYLTGVLLLIHFGFYSFHL